MFTGLIEQQAIVLANGGEIGNRLIVQASFEQVNIGESIAVNGVCLTLLPNDEGYLAFDISPETLSLTNLGQLQVGDKVNLERAMLTSSRFGGHYVSGHIDTIAYLQSITAQGDFIEMLVGDFPIETHSYLLPKGSIALDGVSLTINAVNKASIKLMLVPHTLHNIRTL
jgi:riboflavin synthase